MTNYGKIERMNYEDRLDCFFRDRRKLMLMGLSSKENRKQLDLLYKKWGLKGRNKNVGKQQSRI